MYNRILGARARGLFEDEDKKLRLLVPDVCSRKIPGSHVQQAFVLFCVNSFSYKGDDTTILCVGCHEDTTFEALRVLRRNITGIDPAARKTYIGEIHQVSLEEYVLSSNKDRYDIVFATSVLEHVQDDELFLSSMISLTAPKGYGVLTMDYKEFWRPGDPKPPEDVRLYTSEDIKTRLLPLVENLGCELVDTPQWGEADNDFHYGGVNYTFASLAFRKSYPREP